MLESMAITWVCLYDVLVHLSLPKPKGNEHGREEACGAVAGRGADPFFLGQGDVPTSLPGTRVATTLGEMRPDRERVCCQAALLLAAYEQFGESSLRHGVLESREVFSTKKCLLRSRPGDLWFGGDLTALWLVMQQLGSSAGTVGSSSASLLAPSALSNPDQLL